MLLNVDGRQAYAYTGTRPLRGDAAGVAFVHGAAMDHSVWLLQSRYFAYHGRNALAFDLPGHGRSDGEPLATIAALADWLVRALDAADVERAALVGHSMGALVALDAAARYPQRVDKLALLGVAVPMPVAAPLLDAARADSPEAVDMISVWGHSYGSHLGANPMPGLWCVGGGKRLLEQAAPGVLYTDLNACNDYADGLTRAAELRCPTLFLLGQRDQMTPPRAARDAAAAVADCRTVVVPGCGHMLSYERPDETLDALREFLR